jgi:hypothetical protein
MDQSWNQTDFLHPVRSKSGRIIFDVNPAKIRQKSGKKSGKKSKKVR